MNFASSKTNNHEPDQVPIFNAYDATGYNAAGVEALNQLWVPLESYKRGGDRSLLRAHVHNFNKGGQVNQGIAFLEAYTNANRANWNPAEPEMMNNQQCENILYVGWFAGMTP